MDNSVDSFLLPDSNPLFTFTLDAVDASTLTNSNFSILLRTYVQFDESLPLTITSVTATDYTYIPPAPTSVGIVFDFREEVLSTVNLEYTMTTSTSDYTLTNRGIVFTRQGQCELYHNYPAGESPYPTQNLTLVFSGTLGQISGGLNMYTMGPNGSPWAGSSFQLHGTGLWYRLYTTEGLTKGFFLNVSSLLNVDEQFTVMMTIDNTAELLKGYFNGVLVGQADILASDEANYLAENSQTFVKVNCGGAAAPTTVTYFAISNSVCTPEEIASFHTIILG